MLYLMHILLGVSTSYQRKNKLQLKHFLLLKTGAAKCMLVGVGAGELRPMAHPVSAWRSPSVSAF